MATTKFKGQPVKVIGEFIKVGAVAPKSEVNDTIVDLRPLVYEQPFQRKADKITDAKSFHITYVGVPLVISGLSVKHGSEHFRQLREDFVQNFHYCRRS